MRAHNSFLLPELGLGLPSPSSLVNARAKFRLDPVELVSVILPLLEQTLIGSLELLLILPLSGGNILFKVGNLLAELNLLRFSRLGKECVADLLDNLGPAGVQLFDYLGAELCMSLAREAGVALDGCSSLLDD